jgi:hypothetical protein
MRLIVGGSCLSCKLRIEQSGHWKFSREDESDVRLQQVQLGASKGYLEMDCNEKQLITSLASLQCNHLCGGLLIGREQERVLPFEGLLACCLCCKGIDLAKQQC